MLKKRGVSEGYINVIQDMYRNVKTSVKMEGGQSEYFEVKIGVHQGSALSPYLFVLVIDELLKGVIKEAPWCMLFADDMVIIGETVDEVNAVLEKVRDALESEGLKVNKAKTEHLESRWRGEISSGDRVSCQGVELTKVSDYKYLGSVIQDNGELDTEVTRKMQAGWAKWRAASGVLCDKRIPLKLKGKFYSTVVRPVMKYGSECWALKKAHEQKLHVTEMRMLRLMSGITRKDRMENEYVRQNMGVESMGDVLAQNRLRWYGHLMRKSECDVVKRVWREGTEGKLSRGRPEQMWDATIKNDMKQRALSESMVWDREEWRRSIRIPTLVKLGK